MLRKSLGAAAVLMVSVPAFAQQYNSNDVTPVSAPAGKLTGAGSDGHAYSNCGVTCGPIPAPGGSAI
jgi:hypothetical protein